MSFSTPFTKAVFLDSATIKPEELELSALFDTADEWQLYEHTSTSEVVDRIRDAELIITNKVVLGHNEMSQAKALKLICICATGTNNIDLGAARQLGITVCNVSGYAAASVAQHTMALLLSLATSLNRYTSAVQSGKWSESHFFCMLDYPAFELSGKTFGVVGYGSLGKATAKMAEGLGMKVLVAQTPWSTSKDPHRTPWFDFLEQCDIISIHCPLTNDSKDLFDKKTISKMKQGAVLINTARGGIVNEAALLEALKTGQLKAAALDVLAKEPPEKDHPLIKADLPNLLVTPHSAWVAQECRQRLMDGVHNNIKNFANNRPTNVIKK